MNCKNCGNSIRDGQAFCVNCGTMVERDEPAGFTPQEAYFVPAPVPAPKPKKRGALIVIIVVLVAAISVTATLFLSKYLFSRDDKDTDSNSGDEALVGDSAEDSLEYSTYAAVSDIYIASYPKTMYCAGEELDLISGLSVVARYSDGTEAELELGDLRIEAPDAVYAGEYTARVYYGRHSVSFSFSIAAAELDYIEVKNLPINRSYYVGDRLNTNGLSLTATYKDGSTKTITSGFYCTPTVFDESGTQTVTVSYEGESCTFTVTVGVDITYSVSIGDCITFGRYEQDNNTANGKEDIEWRVLDIQGNRALVISKYVLDTVSYNDVYEETGWENSSVRAWLNNDFMRTAFTTNEISGICTVTNSNNGNPSYYTHGGEDTVDALFLPSFDDLKKYLPTIEARQTFATQYATSRGVYISPNSGASWWWLRSPGQNSYMAASVGATGNVNAAGNIVNYISGGIRPAMWIELQ